MTFQDHFSSQAATYRRFRPQYPTSLFDYLASVAPACKQAWDCATGNGQAAIALADYFEHVTATDASEEQIKQAIENKKITYEVSSAEDCGFADQSQDLITVANALHWFNMKGFYKEAHRVLKPKGVIACWCYESFTVEDKCNQALEAFYAELKPYWPDEIQLIREHYKTIDFPFEEIDPPKFTMELDWTISQCLGYMSSWSAVQTYRKEKGRDPIEVYFDSICDAWGGPSTTRNVTWQLHMRVGRQPG